jgi:hypothetical protein
MPTYIFDVQLQGSGETEEKAWMDAVLNFSLEPGDMPEDPVIVNYGDEE